MKIFSLTVGMILVATTCTAFVVSPSASRCRPGQVAPLQESPQQLNDIDGFFTDQFIPDAELTTNNIAQDFLFAGSDGLMNEMIMQQWQTDLE